MNFLVGFIIGYIVANMDKTNEYRVTPRFGGEFGIDIKYWWLPVWLDSKVFNATATNFDTEEEAQNIVSKFIEAQK